MAKKMRKSDKGLLETTVALEITRYQRDSLITQVSQLSEQLKSATQRAERAEDRLHETTTMLSRLSLQATAIGAHSSVSEIFIEGRSVLRLANPIVVPHTSLARHPQ